MKTPNDGIPFEKMLVIPLVDIYIVESMANRTGAVSETHLDTVSTFGCYHTIKHEMGIFAVYAKIIFKNVIKRDKRKRKPQAK